MALRKWAKVLRGDYLVERGARSPSPSGTGLSEGRLSAGGAKTLSIAEQNETHQGGSAVEREALSIAEQNGII